MGLRESIQQRRGVVGGIVTAIIALAVVYIGWQLFGATPDPRMGSGKVYFTVDDGKTFFVADSSNIPPFDHKGAQAFQAMVFSADGGKTRFVGYMLRFTEAGKAKMRKMREEAEKGQARPSFDPDLQANTEVKRPGDANWIKLSDIAAASRIINVTAPGDPTKPAEQVEP